MKRQLIAVCAALTWSLVAFAGTPTAPAAGKPNNALVLATVNGEKVTAGDLLKLFTERHSGHAAFLGGPSEAKSFLNIVIDETLLTQEAYNLGLDEENAVDEVVRGYVDTNVSSALIKLEITDKAKPSQKDLEAALENLDVVMQVRQVAVATRKEADEIRAYLMQGGDIEAIARSCSGARSARNSGNLMVSWGQFAPEWEQHVLGLESGEISPVIETLDGFEVVLCVNRVEIPRPALKDVAEKLQETLLKRRTAELERALTQHLWTRYHAAFAATDLSPAALYAADPSLTVATWDGDGKLTLGETFDSNELRQLLSLPPVRARNEVEKRIRMTVNSPLSIREGRARKLEELPEVAAKIDEYREYIMKNLLFREHIFKGVEIRDEELKKYYDAHATEFEEAPKLHLAQIMLASEKDAKEIAQKLAGGAPFEEMVKFSRDPMASGTAGDLGWVSIENVPEAFVEIRTLKPGQVAKPVQAATGAWHLVKVLDFKDKRLPPLDEVRQSVREKALESAKREQRAAWVAKLRAASQIEIDAEAIKQFVADHASDGEVPPPQHAMQ